MKKQILTFIMYLSIVLVCMVILLKLNSITDLEPKQTMEEEILSEIEKETETEAIIQTATPDTAESVAENQEYVLPAQGKSGTRRNVPKSMVPQEAVREEYQEEEQEEVYMPPKVIFATDLHVFSPELRDDGLAFENRIKRDDGKVIPYLDEIMEAFINEVIEQKPSALVLSGDLTLDGEKKSHEHLAAMLSKISEAGIQVLAVPGNHDVNNVDARSYFGEEAEYTDYITPEEFAQIYAPYGYEQAASKDEFSLSYLYQLDETHWMMLIDTIDYIPRNRVSGKIRLETFEWMKEQFEEAEKAGAVVIPVGHHNLLEESRLYTQECVIENNAAAIWLLGEWKVPVYFSGHLHAQRIKKYISEPGVPKDAYGIYEIVNSPLVMPPSQFGILEWQDDDSMEYSLKEVDVEQWAKDQGMEDENLLNYNTYQEEFFVDIISNQVKKQINNLSPEQTKVMAEYYVTILRHYVAGDLILAREEKNSVGYQLWERNRPENSYFAEIKAMIKDSGASHKEWSWQAPLMEDNEKEMESVVSD